MWLLLCVVFELRFGVVIVVVESVVLGVWFLS